MQFSTVTSSVSSYSECKCENGEKRGERGESKGMREGGREGQKNKRGSQAAIQEYNM